MKTMKLLSSLFALLLILVVAGGIGVIYLLTEYGSDLPDYKQLASYDPPTVTRVHAGDGRILAEYAIEKRVFVPIEVIPKRVINAFVSAEDQNFYDHYGVDFVAIGRAAVTNVFNMIRDKRPVGASAGREELPAQQRAQDRTQDPRGDPRLPHRAGLHQAAHPRALPEQDLSGLRLLRGRRRIA
jgi:hypothetical protein